MKKFGINSIRHKLSIGVLLTTITALLIFSFIVILYDLDDFRTRTVIDLQTQADLMAEASIEALQKDNPQNELHILNLLKSRPHIIAAAIYKPDGHIFAHYLAENSLINLLPSLSQVERIKPKISQLRITRPIITDNQVVIGSIYLLAKYSFYKRLEQDIAIVAAVAIFALIISMLMSIWIQSHITRPIQQMTDIAHRVVKHQDYQQKLEKPSNDEIGYLIEAFNNMLSEINQRTAALEASNRQLNNEVTERRLTQEALRKSEHRFRNLVTALTAVVWRADANGLFLADQPQWQHYTGQTSDEYSSEGWMNAFDDESKTILQKKWAQYCQHAAPFELQLRLWHAASKNFRYILLHAVPLLNENGHPQEWTGIIDDIQERIASREKIQRLNVELENRVQQRTAELENANKELEAFSYSVSHDLRAPLRSIDGFSQALLEDYHDVLDTTGQDYLTRVRAAAQRMGILIDDLLDLSRVSRAEMHMNDVDLSALAQKIINEFKEAEPQRAINITIEPGLMAFGDQRLLVIALNNLLNNAWKYTGHCKHAVIHFGKQAFQDGECFYIQDNGAGFDMKYADRLFGAFQRLHEAQDFPGTGVGLATVQRIIHRHRGHIWANAEVNRGATFFFTLPHDKE